LNLGSGGVECLTLPATAPKAGSEVSIVATTHGCRFGAKDFGPIDLSYAVPICNDICRVKRKLRALAPPKTMFLLTCAFLHRSFSRAPLPLSPLVPINLPVHTAFEPIDSRHRPWSHTRAASSFLGLPWMGYKGINTGIFHNRDRSMQGPLITGTALGHRPPRRRQSYRARE
jgi:hypothetical protein